MVFLVAVTLTASFSKKKKKRANMEIVIACKKQQATQALCFDNSCLETKSIIICYCEFLFHWPRKHCTIKAWTNQQNAF